MSTWECWPIRESAVHHGKHDKKWICCAGDILNFLVIITKKETYKVPFVYHQKDVFPHKFLEEKFVKPPASDILNVDGKVVPPALC